STTELACNSSPCWRTLSEGLSRARAAWRSDAIRLLVAAGEGGAAAQAVRTRFGATSGAVTATRDVERNERRFIGGPLAAWALGSSNLFCDSRTAAFDPEPVSV